MTKCMEVRKLGEQIHFVTVAPQQPGTALYLPRTSSAVAKALRAAGCDDVVEGIGRTGVVAVISVKSNNRARNGRASLS